MEVNEDDFLGFIKYEGKSVQNGYLDARKSAEALIGFDEVIRYFLYHIKAIPSTKIKVGEI